jgi:hypothetical protein
MGPESDLEDLVSADFVVHFVDFAKTSACADVDLKLSDVSKYDDTEREYEIEFTIDTAAEIEENGQSDFIIPGRKVRTNKNFVDCPIASSVEFNGHNGWEEFLGNEYCTVDLDDLIVTCQVHQIQYIEKLAPTWAKDSTRVPKFLEFGFRFVHWDLTRPYETKQYDEIKIILNSSGEDQSAYCDFETLAITAGTGMT